MSNSFKNYRNEAFQNKESFIEYFDYFAHIHYGKDLSETGMIEKYVVLSEMVKTYMLEDWRETKNSVRTEHKKQIYYFSLEFLLGRMLRNNLMSLGIYDVVKDGLNDLGLDINDIEDIETDAGLGNGGLGRLAACFLDSLATLGYAGHGNTIRYEYGLFKQKIENNKQVEVPDIWLKIGNPWEIRKPKHAVDVKFYGQIETNWNERGKMEVRHINAENT